MNGDWLLLTQAALTTMATNFSIAVVKSLCATINSLTPSSLVSCFSGFLRAQLVIEHKEIRGPARSKYCTLNHSPVIEWSTTSLYDWIITETISPIAK